MRSAARPVIHDRKQVVVVVLSLLAVYAITLVQGHVYRQQVFGLRSTLYTECLSRKTFDVKSQAVRLVFRDYYLKYVEAEKHNRFIDAELRAQRIKDVKPLIATLNEVLSVTPVTRCEVIKP